MVRKYHLSFDLYLYCMENFNKPSTSIKHWAIDDRPREKLIRKGPTNLSDSELLAILIQTGNRDKSALQLAKEILQLGSNNLIELGRMGVKEYSKVRGIGQAKAIAIAAALELGRRRQATQSLVKSVIRTSKDIAGYLEAMLRDYPYEVFGVIFLNRANKIKHFEVISKGGITGTVADPRIILKKALDAEATALILCHNHPSGNLKPSRADKELTAKIQGAASFFDITVTDHIIVSDEGYFSFADDGLL